MKLVIAVSEYSSADAKELKGNLQKWLAEKNMNLGMELGKCRNFSQILNRKLYSYNNVSYTNL